MEQALAPGLQEQPSSSTADSPPPQNVQPHPPPVHSDPNDPPVSSPSSEMSHTCIPPAEMSTASQDPGGEVQPGVAEGGVGGDEVENSAVHATPEDLSPSQPMEQEVTESTETCPAAPSQPESVDMECPSVSHSERDHADGEHHPGSDSVPSLAAALKELHELLGFNNQAQSQPRSSSCSPSRPRGRDSDKSSEPSTPPPENTPPSAATAADAETSDAKASCAAASAEAPSQRVVPDLPAQEERLSVGTAGTAEQGAPRCADGSKETAEDEQDDTNNIRMAQPDVSPGSEPVPEFREPHEEPPGGEDVHASVTNVRDHIQTFLSPLSVEVDSAAGVSSTSFSSAPLLTPAPLLPSPPPFTEQFPAEHVQRIQAAGFSAREAVEALEHAHGVVELALLALLARSITVPT